MKTFEVIHKTKTGSSFRFLTLLDHGKFIAAARHSEWEIEIWPNSMHVKSQLNDFAEIFDLYSIMQIIETKSYLKLQNKAIKIFPNSLNIIDILLSKKDSKGVTKYLQLNPKMKFGALEVENILGELIHIKANANLVLFLGHLLKNENDFVFDIAA